MKYVVAIAALTALAGCSDPKPTVPDVEQRNNEAAANVAATVETPAAVVNAAAPANGKDVAVGEIPAELRGRWGMGPEDCEPGRDDAKGLMTVERATLDFYESRAKLGTIHSADARTLDADFNYSGEGETWTLRVMLALDSDGALTQFELGDGASPEPLHYQRCPA